MWYTGWRTNEVLPLRWNQVELDEGIIQWEVGSTKNKRGRTLAYDGLPGLVELIQRRRDHTDRVEREQERRIKWVFHRDGMKILSKRFYKQWHAAVERAAYRGEGELREVVRPNLVAYEDEKGNLIRPIPHDLRRAAVIHFERAGVPRSVATSITGHQTESVYTRYAIARAKEQREALAKVANYRNKEGTR